MSILPLILLAATQAAQPVTSAPTAGPEHHVPAPPAVSGETTVLPLEFTAGLPTVTASIAGRQVRLGIDTGAPGAAHLTDSLVAELGLSKLGDAKMSDPSGRNATVVPMFALPALTLGGLEIRDWRATAAPARSGKLESLDGIIGISAFRGYVVTIDYAGRQLRIARGALPQADGKTVFAYGNQPIPRVPLTIEDRTVTAHIDTGNVAAPVIVPTSFAQKLDRRSEARFTGNGRTVSNRISMQGFPINGAAKVGSVKLSAVDVTYPSVINMANIGSKALTGLVLQVDPANGRVSLSKPPSA